MAENQTMELYKSWMPVQYVDDIKPELQEKIEDRVLNVGTLNGKTFLDFLKRISVLNNCPNMAIVYDGIRSLNVDPAYVAMNQGMLTRTEFYQYSIDGNVYQFAIDSKALIQYLKSIGAKELKTLMVELSINERTETRLDQESDALLMGSSISHLIISSDKGTYKQKVDSDIKIKVPRLSFESEFKTEVKPFLAWLKMVQKHTDNFQIIINGETIAKAINDDKEFVHVFESVHLEEKPFVKVFLPLDYMVNGLSSFDGEITILCKSDNPIKVIKDQENWFLVAPRIEND